jgi:hypothetical protein
MGNFKIERSGGLVIDNKLNLVGCSTGRSAASVPSSSLNGTGNRLDNTPTLQLSNIGLD